MKIIVLFTLMLLYLSVCSQGDTIVLSPEYIERVERDLPIVDDNQWHVSEAYKEILQDSLEQLENILRKDILVEKIDTERRVGEGLLRQIVLGLDTTGELSLFADVIVDKMIGELVEVKYLKNSFETLEGRILGNRILIGSLNEKTCALLTLGGTRNCAGKVIIVGPKTYVVR
jgi:hypothetical protein